MPYEAACMMQTTKCSSFQIMHYGKSHEVSIVQGIVWKYVFINW